MTGDLAPYEPCCPQYGIGDHDPAEHGDADAARVTRIRVWLERFPDIKGGVIDDARFLLDQVDRAGSVLAAIVGASTYGASPRVEKIRTWLDQQGDSDLIGSTDGGVIGDARFLLNLLDVRAGLAIPRRPTLLADGWVDQVRGALAAADLHPEHDRAEYVAGHLVNYVCRRETAAATGWADVAEPDRCPIHPINVAGDCGACTLQGAVIVATPEDIAAMMPPGWETT